MHYIWLSIPKQVGFRRYFINKYNHFKPDYAIIQFMTHNLAKTLHKQSLAVIGGGRWGRIIVSILATMDLAFDQVVIVTNINAENMQRLIRLLPSKASTPFTIVPSLNNLLTEHNVKAAIIVNDARQHFSTAARLLVSRIPTLIEKPLALSKTQAQTLLSNSINSGVCLLPGLQYRFCSYIHDFASHIKRFCKKPRSFSVIWSDQANEIRYGETKTYDSSIDVAQDVMPHIWSILFTIFQQTAILFNSCQISNKGHYANFSITMDGIIPGHIVLERDATQRQRLIVIKFDKKNTLSMDFSTEPGSIFLNGKIISTNSEWDITQRPLIRQLNYFFSHMHDGATSAEDIHACLESVSFCEEASALLQIYQKPWSPP